MNMNFVNSAMAEVENLIKDAFAKAMQEGKLPQNELPNFSVEIPFDAESPKLSSKTLLVSPSSSLI